MVVRKKEEKTQENTEDLKVVDSMKVVDVKVVDKSDKKLDAIPVAVLLLLFYVRLLNVQFRVEVSWLSHSYVFCCSKEPKTILSHHNTCLQYH